jgi:hypothetical protein
MFLVIIMPWPLDALFFKFQGLATDFALCIDLGRLYYHNKAIHGKASVGTLIPNDGDDESNDEYAQECDKLVQQMQQGRFEVNDDPKKPQYHVKEPVHSNIAILYIAAGLHAGGNALVTFANHFYL